jgi:hypothetical protein
MAQEVVSNVRQVICGVRFRCVLCGGELFFIYCYLNISNCRCVRKYSILEDCEV